MPQKIGIVVDAACDLPRNFLQQHGLEIMPINMQFGTMNFKDVRDPEQTMEFYRRYVAEKELEITTAPLPSSTVRRTSAITSQTRSSRTSAASMASSGFDPTSASRASIPFLKPCGRRTVSPSASPTEALVQALSWVIGRSWI